GAAHGPAAGGTAATNAGTRSGSFTPGLDSTPEATSTPSGAARRTASATLSGVSPPASQKGKPKRRASRASDQSKLRPEPPNPSARASSSSSEARSETESGSDVSIRSTCQSGTPAARYSE